MKLEIFSPRKNTWTPLTTFHIKNTCFPDPALASSGSLTIHPPIQKDKINASHCKVIPKYLYELMNTSIMIG